MTDPGAAIAPPAPPRRVFDVRLPADAAWMSPLRAFVTDLAARLELDLDRVADLTLAVDEACSLLLAGLAPDAAPDAALRCGITVTQTDVEVAVEAAVAPDVAGGLRSTFGWHVLSALVDAAELARGEHGSTVIRLCVARPGPAIAAPTPA